MDSHSTSFDICNKLDISLYNRVYQQLAGSIKHTTFRSAETTPERECLTEAPSTQTPSDDTIISQNDLLARKIGHTAFCCCAWLREAAAAFWEDSGFLLSLRGGALCTVNMCFYIPLVPEWKP